MNEAELASALRGTAEGRLLRELAESLFPIPRSLTGDGVRDTLRRIGTRIPLTIHEVPTGTSVLDWTVPDEWNVREAWLAGPDGRRIADWARSPLHLVGYSTPIRTRLTLAELRPHLHSSPDRPDDIPYRTSYWKRTWGFCLPHRELTALPDGEYEVVIDATLGPGSLTYGECVLPGELPDTVLLSAHVCHPALANDNLSGIAVAVFAAAALASVSRRFSYRIVFAPATLGAITWLARNPEAVALIRHGLVLSCLGDRGPLVYKKTRRENALVDAVAEHVLRHHGPGSVRRFDPYGYDERQYGSPGFDLPVGRLTRTPNGEYPEYHTSADDLSILDAGALQGSLAAVLRIIQVLEQNRSYRNLAPFGEPQLGRRGLYGGLRGANRLPEEELALLWVLNQSAGDRSLLEIADRAELPFMTIRAAADALVGAGLLAESGTNSQGASQ